MSIRARQVMFLSLLAAFLVQTYWVYSDPTGRANPPLSDLARKGRGIWLGHGCQTCHQIHGFGGFLGPDLTNAVERLTDSRLETVLTVGAGQMPAFGLDAQQRRAIAQFLEELNETGIGHLPPLVRVEALAVLAQGVERGAGTEGGALTELESKGRDVLYAQKCIGCHLPNPATEHKGTDLTTLIGKLQRDGVKGILSVGIPAKGMPRFNLTAEEIDALLAFLSWLGAHAEEVHAAFRDAAPKAEPFDLPWFEYE